MGGFRPQDCEAFLQKGGKSELIVRLNQHWQAAVANQVVAEAQLTSDVLHILDMRDWDRLGKDPLGLLLVQVIVAEIVGSDLQ